MDVRDDVIEVKAAAVKLLGQAVMGLLMTAAGAALARFALAGSLRQFIGWIGALFFGAVTLMLLWQLLSAGKVVLRLDRDGVLDRRLSRLPVPWQEIRQVGIWAYKGQQLIVLDVSPETEGGIGLTRRARMTRSMNAGQGADGLCISATGLGISHDALLQAIIARVEVAQHG